MIITNKLNLPESIIEAIKNDPYSSGDADISVTALIDSPRIKILTDKHHHEIEIDAADEVNSLIGQGLHSVLEKANKKAIAERRLAIDIEGWKVSGGMDLFDEAGILSDYKVTHVGGINKTMERAELQMNCYAVILRHHGFQVEHMQAILFLRDWYRYQVNNPTQINYPKSPIVNIPIQLWDAKIAEKYMRERVILHKQSRITLPECSAQDRWGKEQEWAIFKPGNKKATKVVYNADEANAIATQLGPNYYVVYRPANGYGRCENYCDVAQFCDQFNKQSLKLVDAS